MLLLPSSFFFISPVTHVSFGRHQVSLPFLYWGCSRIFCPCERFALFPWVPSTVWPLETRPIVRSVDTSIQSIFIHHDCLYLLTAHATQVYSPFQQRSQSLYNIPTLIT